MLNEAIDLGVALAVAARPNPMPGEQLAGAGGLPAFAEDRLLCALLETTPICDFGLEQFITAVRCHLLMAAWTMTGAVTEPILGLYSAIARQCFINSYVFAQSPLETAWLNELRDRLVTALASGAPFPALSVVAVAACIPLHTLQGAEALLDRQWPQSVAAVVAQQVCEPLDEQRSRATMPVLTRIGNGVSLRVRGQYEEHPYPQWIKVPSRNEPDRSTCLYAGPFRCRRSSKPAMLARLMS